MKLPDHFMVGCESDLIDTRKDFLSIRPNYRKTHSEITSIADLKATLRAGQYAWPGGYPLYFITVDGGALSFESVLANFREVIEAIKNNNDPQWQVVACRINYESELYCYHSGKPIESAYGDDTPNLDSMDIDELREFANNKDNPEILQAYARGKVTAMKYRQEGYIQEALSMEKLIDETYQALPDELKW